MSTSDSQTNRRPKGTSEGGQFAPKAVADTPDDEALRLSSVEEPPKKKRTRKPLSEGKLLALSVSGLTALGGLMGSGAAFAGQLAGEPGAASIAAAGPLGALVVGGVSAAVLIPSYLVNKPR